MNDILYYIISSVLVVGVLIGIYLMSNVKTAVKGNLTGSVCIAIGIIVTVIRYDIVSNIIIWICIAVSLLIGLTWASKVHMIQMPQLVALYNGFGGAASAIVASLSLMDFNGVDIFAKATAAFALAIGMCTLLGSLIAAGKLHKVISQRPLIWKLHKIIIIITLILMIASIVAITAFKLPSITMVFILAILSAFFGIVFTIRVGGADMPITISLLNSLSGVAGAIAGMAISDPLLVAIGGIVGASGLLLTQIMCKSMNRKLMDILLGRTSSQKIDAEINQAGTYEDDISALNTSTRNTIEKETLNPIEILKIAKNIIIIPGYGMALAQAQYLVKQLVDKLEASGAEVRFGIHPVAGRMPGHMNVLLSEVDIPYENLFEIDDINTEFYNCDVTIIIGANDVVNPAARNQEHTPIYGMPILNADQAKHVIICNFDLKPGYAGVENPLYSKTTGVSLYLGDAKESLKLIIDSL